MVQLPSVLGSKMMNRRFVLVAVILVALGAVAGGLFGRLPATSADNSVTAAKIVADYREALAAIDQNYVGKVDHEKVADTSIQSMLWTLDPHSQFFTREEFRKLSEEQASQFYGIGVSILQHRDGVYVQSVLPGTPAEKAGLRYGDRFLLIDGKDAKEWTSAEVSRNVRGERGTTVKVKIERAASAAPIDFEIVRGGVPLPSIRNYFMLPNGVGYVGLTGGFQETTADELDMAIDELQKQGMKSLILDVRNNPGGLLPQAVDVVGRFIPSGQPVVSVKGRSRYAREQQLSTRGGMRGNLPLVVLINGGSASASEIVAGAIQDYNRGTIVGTESFGKGLVQRVFPLPFQSGLTLTTARYYTPLGRSLQRDYSSGSIYEYYTHSDGTSATATPGAEAKPTPAGVPITTPDGRTLFGGRGIEPDVKVEAAEYNATRFRLNEAVFFFVRQAVAGKIAGFESLKVDRQNHQIAIPATAIPVNDRLFEAFRTFALADPKNNLTADVINSDAAHVRTRIRQELASANYSNEASAQVFLEVDPQVLKAIEVMPEAFRKAEVNLATR
jgi:carboxyl-terminal processing protease